MHVMPSHPYEMQHAMTHEKSTAGRKAGFVLGLKMEQLSVWNFCLVIIRVHAGLCADRHLCRSCGGVA
jgi:hypothetical protein